MERSMGDAHSFHLSLSLALLLCMLFSLPTRTTVLLFLVESESRIETRARSPLRKREAKQARTSELQWKTPSLSYHCFPHEKRRPLDAGERVVEPARLLILRHLRRDERRGRRTRVLERRLKEEKEGEKMRRRRGKRERIRCLSLSFISSAVVDTPFCWSAVEGMLS